MKIAYCNKTVGQLRTINECIALRDKAFVIVTGSANIKKVQNLISESTTTHSYSSYCEIPLITRCLTMKETLYKHAQCFQQFRRMTKRGNY